MECVMMNEEWRAIPGYEGRYSVSSVGRVRSEDRIVVEKTGMAKSLRGRLLRPTPNRGGYPSFNVTVGGKRVALRVHRAVALAFLGRPPSAKHEVSHCDGNPSNNHLSNLRWDTRAGNFADKVKHGTHNRGERHPNSRLSNADIDAIRASPKCNAQIAIQYGISQEYAQRVRANLRRRNG